MEALQKAQTAFLDLAETRFKALAETGSSDLTQKKSLIDQRLDEMKVELGKVSTLVNQLEKDREGKFVELNTHIKAIGEQTAALTTSTNTLRQALSSSQARGQWGERMADDLLRNIGFVEGMNYLKQATVRPSGSRPDFTFLLPRDLKLNMDVKFPFENYVRYLEAEDDGEKQRHKTSFLRDVRARIQEVTGKDYIDAGQGTVDYVLLFIPNEGVFAFIREEDPDMFETALKSKVVCCSPITLFVVLAIVRQAVDNFALEQTSNEILSHLGQFRAQWDNFGKSIDMLGTRLASTQEGFRRFKRSKEPRPRAACLSKIEELRLRRGIQIAPGGDDDDDAVRSLESGVASAVGRAGWLGVGSRS